MTKSDMDFQPDYKRAFSFFQQHDDYKPSPLVVKDVNGVTVWVKDETDRMGLGAFKALGGPYAIARHIVDAWNQKMGADLSDTDVLRPEIKSFAGDFTFICASAGNHGAGVAVGARAAGVKARVVLAKTVPAAFGARLEGYGAEVIWAGENYSESVEFALKEADRSGDILIADGSWPGYSYFPKLIMEGYTVIAEEMRQEFETSGDWPSHVYLQAGVGGLACAVAHMIRENWAVQPKIIVVEPDAAPCLKASHDAGEPTDISGPESIMGRLDCKEPSHVAFYALERCDVEYVTITDIQAAGAAKLLEGMGLSSTPSGVAGFAALKEQIASGAPSNDFKPLVIISEGQV